MQNKVTSEAGAKITANGFRSTGICCAIQMGKSELPLIDYFGEILPLVKPFSEFFQLQLDLDEELRENEDSAWADKDKDNFEKMLFIAWLITNNLQQNFFLP